MGSPSKEQSVIELFYNEPTKHWHFNQIVKSAKVSERAASHWLNKLLKMKIIKRRKPKGKMPYFIADYDNPAFFERKRIYGLNKMLETGLIQELQSLKAQTVVIFGSFARGDWHTSSDIDIFVLGNPGSYKYGGIARSLHRELQMHAFKNKKELKKIRSPLLHNVINGYFIKGKVHDLVEVSA